ncbi:MAG: S41 family peptidase [Gemmatimonadota bacterium]
MTPHRARTSVALAVVLTALVSGGSLLNRGMTGGGRSGGVTNSRERLFDQVVEHVGRRFLDSLPTDEIFEKALTGMLEELGDPHTTYLEPDRLRRLAESTSGIYTGLGVRVASRDGWPTVIAPLPGSPSERAGLLAGDRIVEVDGRPSRGWTDEETRIALRGPPGTSIILTVERPGLGQRREVTVIRGEIYRTAVRRLALLSNRVGYVDVKAFSDSTEIEVARAVDSLSRAGMTSLVLDLRGNPGGLLTQGVAVSELFLDPGKVIVSMKGRTTETTRSYRDSIEQRWPGLPVAVLVDNSSASAAEIVAGALQDNDRAIVLGHPTFGKGSAQAVFQTPAGGGLKLTTARWYTPLGRSIERIDPGDEDTAVGERIFTTPAGRRVRGGGGIIPDVTAGDTGLTSEEMLLQMALGERVPEFRDALTAYALSLRGSGRFRDPFAPVTPAMLSEVWQLLQRRGFDFERSIFDGARRLVSRLLGRELARYVFDPDAEARRSIRDDEVIQRAAALVGGASSQAGVFARSG